MDSSLVLAVLRVTAEASISIGYRCRHLDRQPGRILGKLLDAAQSHKQAASRQTRSGITPSMLHRPGRHSASADDQIGRSFARRSRLHRSRHDARSAHIRRIGLGKVSVSVQIIVGR
jgi:hypothetical protein